MAAGELLPDDIVLDLLRERISGTSGGCLLDGFPRTVAQATAMLEGAESSAEESFSLRPDAVILLERPDELAKEFALGRCVDSTTGHTYHPKYAPPPVEVHSHLTWRVDDSFATLERRIAQHRAEAGEIVGAFEQGGVPVQRVDNARSELATFAEVADFIVEVAMGKIARKREELQREKADVTLEEAAAALQANVLDEDDVEAVCEADADLDECVLRYQEDEARGQRDSPLLAAVERCNTFDLSEYQPVLVGDEQSARERSSVVAALVSDLVADGFIPAHKVRNELQDVGALASGFVGPDGRPLVRMERAAIVPFGIQRFGVHVNGWVRDPSAPDDATPCAMWVAKRAMSKATYPGLLDQMVAGGQPSGVGFLANVRKECAEEASLPAEELEHIQSTGAVSYRYTTRNGLSSATLMTYDLEMPHGLLPLCADGEVEEFTLMPIADVLRSLREELPRWRPNAALVAIDFLMKRGFIDADNEPEYEAIDAMLSLKT